MANKEQNTAPFGVMSMHGYDPENGELPVRHVAELVPMVLERVNGGERAVDLFSLLLRQGLMDITGPIDSMTAKLVTAQLRYVAREVKPLESDGGIQLFINSPGGEVSSGLAIYDAIQTLGTPVHTIVRGTAASMGALLACCGSPGKRHMSRHSKIMIHQPLISGLGRTKATELKIEMKEIDWCYDRIAGIIAKHSGMDIEQVRKDIVDDRWLDADEACAYGKFGLVDSIIDDVPPSEDE